jgi:hypothetical protein
MKKMLLLVLMTLGLVSLYAAEAPVSDRDAALAMDEANQTMAAHEGNETNMTDAHPAETAPAQ